MLCSLGEPQFDETPLLLCPSSPSHHLRFYLSAVLEQAVNAQNYCTATNKLQQKFRNKFHNSSPLENLLTRKTPEFSSLRIRHCNKKAQKSLFLNL